ncbi:uncharacterized protein LOC117785955 [Drosophila innubila]|uniref:uncharacterized protein LOC117785955 n=1 Tax=Drosophila innubila TaxID=198719 RepID=UPI00148DCE1A|nr:uncharacterized protein LOC117785955 [Drosophila innubila]
MIFLQLWWTLMVLTGSNTLTPKSEQSKGSDKLRSFHHAVNEAREQLHELHANYGNVQDSELFRHRRNSIDELLASFAQAGDKEAVQDKDDKTLQRAADDWFRDFQAGVAPAAKHSRSTGRTKGKTYVNDYGKMLEQTEIGKVKKKYKEYHMEGMPPLSAPIEQQQPMEPLTGGATQLDIKLKHVQQLLANQEMEQQHRDYNRDHKEHKDNREKDEKLPEFGDNSVPDGIYEQTLARLQIAHMNPNNLSHEANYKLSKIEQEAAERAGKMRYPSGLQKRSSSAGFNPMNEIKLKTSNRLMRKGMGPSLPSNALTDNIRAHYVDDLLMRRERNMKRERERQQQQQKLQQEETEDEKNPYDELNSAAGGSSSLNAPSMNILETPQSYDYRLPQFDQLHTLNQRTLPNMRDFVQANTKLNQKAERFKRQQKVKESEVSLESGNDIKLETDAKAEAEEHQEEVKLELDTANANKLENAASEELKTVQTPEVKSEKPLETAALSQSKPQQVRDPDQTPQNEVNSESAAPSESKLQQVRDPDQTPQNEVNSETAALSEVQQVRDPDQTPQNEVNSESAALSESKPQQVRDPDQEENESMPKTESKLKAEDSKSTARLESHPDAVVKLLANKISQQSSMERDKRNIKRWTWHRFHRQKGSHAAMEASQPKRRSRRSVEPQAAETSKTAGKLLDDFEDHNGNRVPFGSLGNGMLTVDANEAEEVDSLPYPRHQLPNIRDEADAAGHVDGLVDSNTFANSRYQPLYGMHRYLGPFMNKVGKGGVTVDPCVTTTVSPESTTMNPDCVPITKPDLAGTTGDSGDSSNPCANADAVKLKISMNGNLCSDPKTKQLFGNGSINVQPSSQRMNAEAYYELVDALVDESEADMDNEHRYTRQANRSINRDKNKDKDKETDTVNDTDIEKTKEKRKDRNNDIDRAKEKEWTKDNHKRKVKKYGKSDKIKNMAKKSKGAKNNTTASRDIDRSEPVSDSFDKLMTGKASEEIVRAVFEMVSNDPTMDPLLSVLARNRKTAYKRPKTFYQIRNDRNEEHLQQTEEMVRKTMESISDIIDTQMRQRSCIPLRPDLVEFYDMIVKTMAEQQKTREKREVKLSLLSEDYNQDVRILDANNIEQKSRIVKKLLRQYDELPLEEQRRAAAVRDELLMDLIYLRKMADTLERSQRNAQLQGVLGKTSGNEAADQQMYSEYTPRFIKLLKTAEIFKEVGEQQAKQFIGI